MSKLFAVWIHKVEGTEGYVADPVAVPLLPPEFPGAPAEPDFDWLKAKLDGAYVEHVSVAPGISVWCDEEFRLKSTEPSAIVRGTRGVFDFGGPLVITAPSEAALLAFMIGNVRVPPPGFELEPARFEITSFEIPKEEA